MSAAMIADLLVGESAVMVRLRDLVLRLAPARLPVLVQGPTGAGKELVAQALHRASGRKGRCVAFNACAIPDAMFEDALFGHVRGAFSGASHDHTGYLGEANGGTVFMDEIGSLGIDAQAKLLRAVETRVFRPVGARRDQESDFRLVTATNVRLGDLVGTGRFRPDLAHRISAAVITVPALAEHPEDIPALAEHFAREAAAAHER
jgi:DNA-binding NtrC family response regulator